MSDNEDYSWFYIIIPILVLWFIFSAPNLSSFFNSDKTETWIKAEREATFYTEGLKEDWVSFVSGWVTVKCKLRKSMSGKDSYDFIYKIESKLIEPKLKDYNDSLVKNYRVYPRFKLIDEDGFIVREISDTYSHFNHENHLSRVIWTEDDYPVEREVVASLLVQNLIPEDVAKRISKIKYELKIEARIDPKEVSDETFWERRNHRKCEARERLGA